MGDTRPRRLEERLLREVGLIALLLLVALLQTSLARTPAGLPVPLVLVLVICRAVLGLDTSSNFSTDGALRWALYGGLSLDLIGNTPLGVHVLALLPGVVVALIVARTFQNSGAVVPLLCVAIAATIYEVLLAATYHIMVTPLDWQPYSTYILLPAVLLALIPTLPVFHLMRWQGRRG